MFKNYLQNKVIRYWKYKKVYTPYEQTNCFIDEGEFEDTDSTYGLVEEVFTLNNNIILVIRVLEENNEDEYELIKTDILNIVNMSEISLSIFESDTKRYF